MKKFVLTLCAVALSMAIAIPAVQAQDPGAEPAKQLELATLLANLMGLSRALPAAPSAQQIFTILAINGVSPEEGWDAEKVVTKADLARTVVQAMGAAAEIEIPDDPNAWVGYLEAMGISIETIGSAVSEVGPSDQPVAGSVSRAGTTWDPLDNVSRFGEPDERDFGADVQVLPPVGTGTPPVAVPPPPPAPVEAVRRPVPRREIPRVPGLVPVPTPPVPVVPVTPTVPQQVDVSA